MAVSRGAWLGQIKPEVLASIEDQIADAVVQKLMDKAIIKSPDEAVVREILPKEDLGFTNETWTVDLTTGTANAYNAVVNGTQLGEKKALIIYAMKVITRGNVTFVKFATGSQGNIIKDIVDVTKYDPQTGLVVLRTPIGYEPKDYMYISYYITSTTGATPEIVLIGKVAEPVNEIFSG